LSFAVIGLGSRPITVARPANGIGVARHGTAHGFEDFGTSIFADLRW
jgi:hypothetical protein